MARLPLRSPSWPSYSNGVYRWSRADCLFCDVKYGEIPKDFKEETVMRSLLCAIHTKTSVTGIGTSMISSALDHWREKSGPSMRIQWTALLEAFERTHYLLTGESSKVDFCKSNDT